MPSTEEDRKRAARAEQVALFRYQLIREAADPALSVRQRGRLVREIAARTHKGPFGEPVAVSRATIDRWIRAWRSGGFARSAAVGGERNNLAQPPPDCSAFRLRHPAVAAADDRASWKATTTTRSSGS